MVKLLAWLPAIGFKAKTLQPPQPSFINTGNQITKASPIDGGNLAQAQVLRRERGCTQPHILLTG